jgi:hypothetical protein
VGRISERAAEDRDREDPEIQAASMSVANALLHESKAG